MSAVTIGLRVLEGRDPDLPLPAAASAGAAGHDICANLAPQERAAGRRLEPGGWTLVPTGLAFAIPDGFEIQMRPRSGLALRHGVTLLNAPGTIDSDYRGEVGVLLINHGSVPFVVAHGMRIAQMVVAPVNAARFEARIRLDATARGAGGFGSTGVRAAETAGER